MSLAARKKILLAKIESVYGTDSVPTGAANAMRTKNFQLQPLQANVIGRDLDRPVLGNDLAIHVGSHVACTFDVEIAGAGAVDSAPAYGPLLRACGLAETITPTTGPVEYDPVSASFESVSCYFHHDGQLHAFLGARGNVSLALTPLGIPVYRFSLMGLWVDPAAVADPTPDWSSFQTPVAVDNDNTPVFTLHGASYTLVDLSIDLANQVTYRNLPGEESVVIVDRAVAGSVTLQAPALGTKNWFTVAKANTTGALALTHGTVAGNKVMLAASTVQVLNPRYGDTDGVSTVQMDLRFIPSDSGDDEIQISTQ